MDFLVLKTDYFLKIKKTVELKKWTYLFTFLHYSQGTVYLLVRTNGFCFALWQKNVIQFLFVPHYFVRKQERTIF